ncbi:hypothetical protein C0Q70_05264 [Pomacea canaliculata]|uniref:Uncharacterized protein n=1 Tax=Pomacea canaliculata TaxID=400727 RepID=A0A2T7PKS6_POMCA|nr:hypothetical protein C0Q70_05264 [Pomacea canaliculata]
MAGSCPGARAAGRPGGPSYRRFRTRLRELGAAAASTWALRQVKDGENDSLAFEGLLAVPSFRRRVQLKHQDDEERLSAIFTLPCAYLPTRPDSQAFCTPRDRMKTAV